MIFNDFLSILSICSRFLPFLPKFCDFCQNFGIFGKFHILSIFCNFLWFFVIFCDFWAKSGQIGQVRACPGNLDINRHIQKIPFMILCYHAKNRPKRSSGSRDIELRRIERSDWPRAFRPITREIMVLEVYIIRNTYRKPLFPVNLSTKWALYDQPFSRYEIWPRSGMQKRPKYVFWPSNIENSTRNT